MRLASNNPAIASVPTTVTVPAGQTRTTFAITTTPVAVDTPVRISAQRGQSDAHSAMLTVQAPRLQNFTLSPLSVQGGGSVQGTIKLTGPVAAGAQVVVELRTSGGAGGAAVSLPPSVSIGPGLDRGTIGIRTQPVASATTVTIGASYAGVTKTVTLTITAAPVVSLASLGCNPTTVTGGNPVSCTVNLTGPAPSGGAPVSLSSNRPAVAAVPTGTTVAAGASSAPFAVMTASVASSTSVTISASYGGSTKTATLTVNPVVLSDLSIKSYRLTDIAGQPLPDTATAFDLHVTVANAPSVGPAPASTLRVQVTSSQPVFGYPQTQTATTPPLAPGGSAESRVRFNGLTRGYTYTFSLCADAPNAVPETNEANNCTAFPVTQH